MDEYMPSIRLAAHSVSNWRVRGWDPTESPASLSLTSSSRDSGKVPTPQASVSSFVD